MDYVPTPEQVKKTLPEFIIDDSQIEGLYGNMDVDSMIFRYTPKVNAQTSAEDILISIIAKSQKEGWKLVEKKQFTLLFNRFGPSGKFFSAEEVRVIVVQKNLRIYVAWVRAISRKPILQFEEDARSKWAKQVIWPKLETCIAQEEGK